MEITGRLTADAKIGKTPTGQEVVNFNVAVNERYRTKEGEVKTITEYFNCAIWYGTKIIAILKKGTAVSLTGRVSATGYKAKDGTIKGALNFRTSNVNIIAKAPASAPAEGETTHTGPQGNDDLPF